MAHSTWPVQPASARMRPMRRHRACIACTLALVLFAARCRPGPTEPPPEPDGGDPDYLACPRGTIPWGWQPVNPVRWWCELPDGGLHGPYLESWPSDTVRGSLGPRPEGLRVKGWYENGERVGLWQYWYPDGGLERTERLRPREVQRPSTSGCRPFRFGGDD